MSFNTSLIGLNKDYTIYVPTSCLNYKYILNINSDYIDLLDTDTIQPNNSYNYIRVFFNRPRLN